MDKNNIEISIIMPAYKAGGFIKAAVLERHAILSALSVPFEIIVVLDGEDQLAAAELGSITLPELNVVHYEKNRGKGFAVKYGMSLAQGKYIGYIDADFDLDSKLITDMYAAIKSTGADVIIPSKMHPDSVVDYPTKRRFLSRIYYTGLRVLFNVKVSDTQTGAKLYRRSVLRKIIKQTRVERFAFEIEMLYLANKLGYRNFVEVPIKLDYQFTSSIRPRDGVKAIFDTISVFIAHRTPLQYMIRSYRKHISFRNIKVVDATHNLA